MDDIKYNPDDKPICPKCGYEQFFVKYCRACHYAIHGIIVHHTPRMHRICRQCGYYWLELPLDAKIENSEEGKIEDGK